MKMIGLGFTGEAEGYATFSEVFVPLGFLQVQRISLGSDAKHRVVQNDIVKENLSKCSGIRVCQKQKTNCGKCLFSAPATLTYRNQLSSTVNIMLSKGYFLQLITCLWTKKPGPPNPTCIKSHSLHTLICKK